MEYKKLGNSKKLIPVGDTVELTCSNCKQNTTMSVFRNSNLRLKADFPLFNSDNVYLIICPKCASTFGVDSKAGKEFKNGEKLAIGNFDLKDLEKIEF